MDGFYADTLRLQKHRNDILLAEEQKAKLLVEYLKELRNITVDPEIAYVIERCLRKAENLSQYFHSMAQTTDNMCMELDNFSKTIAIWLTDCSNRVERLMYGKPPL